jgi:ferritin
MDASMTYLKLSSWFESKNLTGISSFLKKEGDSEMTHAWEIVEYINKRSGSAIIPPTTPKDFPLEKYSPVFDSLLELERETERELMKVMEAARADNDYATEVFLQKLILE